MSFSWSSTPSGGDPILSAAQVEIGTGGSPFRPYHALRDVLTVYNPSPSATVYLCDGNYRIEVGIPIPPQAKVTITRAMGSQAAWHARAGGGSNVTLRYSETFVSA